MKSDREIVAAAAQAGIAAGMRLFQRRGLYAHAPTEWVLSATSAQSTAVFMP